MRAVRIVLVALVMVGTMRIGWSYVDTGEIPNPLNGIRSLVVSIDSSIDDTLRP